jgi:phage shock protein PspC (stress-responsive transcriptional regulator)
MNKIININLAGRLIPIDESAYDLLRDYLNRLRSFFSREKGGDEIVRDMEDRMGELFQDQLKKGKPCIMAEDIHQMIAIMGSPEQIEHESGEEETKQSHSQESGQTTDSTQDFFNTKGKRLAKSSREKMVGGVCGGFGAYFNIDPTFFRVAFVLLCLAGGAGVLVYILLWALLPTSDAEAPRMRKRLYRNPQHKVLGGVCSGIASYTNIDPIIPRVIFAAPLLGIIFFSIFDHNWFFFPAMTGGLPTFILLYFILWASLPEANTVAEKLEMRGEKVDVHSLNQAMKSEETEKVTTPRRSGLGQLFSVMVKIFVFFILGSILLTLAGFIIAVIVAMFGVATSSFFLFPFSSLVTENETYKTLIWICIIVVLLIPFIAIIRLLVRVITGRRSSTKKWVSTTLSLIFVAAIFGLFWMGATIASDFKSDYTKTVELPIKQPNSDTLFVRQTVIDDAGIVGDHDWDNEFSGRWNHGNDDIRFRDDSTIAVSNLNLHFTNSMDSNFHLLIQKSSQGRNVRRAQLLAESLDFNFRQDGNVLILPNDFNLPKGQPFRAQKISIEIQVPKGKIFKTEGINPDFYTNRIFRIRRGGFHYNSENMPSWDDDVFYKMEKDGPISLAPKKKDNDDKNSDNNNDDNDN